MMYLVYWASLNKQGRLITKHFLFSNICESIQFFRTRGYVSNAKLVRISDGVTLVTNRQDD